MNRALSIKLLFLAATIWRTTGSLLCGPVMSQKRASSVCRAERLLLAFPPKSLISLYSVAHCSLLSAIGGSGRNCDALVSANGLTFDQVEETVIGVGT
jgi:hypothetical protein